MTPQDGGLPMTCHTPIDEGVLADYWLALLAEPEMDGVEQHLLECDGCGDRLRALIVLCDALRAVSRSGSLRVIVAEEFIQRAVEAGHQVRQYDFAPGQTVHCTIAADDDLLMGRLAADLSGVERVDLSFCGPDGVERQRMQDIPIRADTGHVILHESAVLGKLSPTTTMIARLLAVEADGGERVLGEYTFRHTRTIPGPPSLEW
jgi:hypothetical protein